MRVDVCQGKCGCTGTDMGSHGKNERRVKKRGAMQQAANVAVFQPPKLFLLRYWTRFINGLKILDSCHHSRTELKKAIRAGASKHLCEQGWILPSVRYT